MHHGIKIFLLWMSDVCLTTTYNAYDIPIINCQREEATEPIVDNDKKVEAVKWKAKPTVDSPSYDTYCSPSYDT